MPCSAKNDKGLCAGFVPVPLISGAALDSLRELLSDPPASLPPSAAESLHALESALRSLPLRHAYASTPLVFFFASLSGWNNASEPIPLSAAEFLAQTGALEILSSRRAEFRDALALLPPPLAEPLLAALPLAPSLPALRKIRSYRIEDIGAESNAAPAEGFALWMERGQGFMDLAKRPAGLSSARLFESPSAAERTAKAAGFGDSGSRGPCAVVRVAIEPISVESRSRPGAPLGALEAAISAHEASLLEMALSMGGSFSPQAAEAARSDSLAGSSLGHAFWSCSPDEPRFPSGFLNKAHSRGPLSGATLFPSPERAESFGVAGLYRGDYAIALARLRPLRVESRLGAAPASAVEAACSLERERALLEALARSGSGSPAHAPSGKRRGL